jgi:hypothetical protein
MKVICVFILFICALTATFSNWVLIAAFKINQTYIARELCVNRNNPNSNCKGQCYLCKQLNKQEKPEGTNGTTGKEKLEIQLFFVDVPDDGTGVVTSSKSFLPFQQQFTEQPVLKSVFHPPSV